MKRVFVVPYDPGWPAAYARAAGEVASAIGENLVEIHHIGSTAVPGLCAKPVIDMLPVVADLAALDARTDRLVALGYEALGEFGIPGRRYFRRDDAAGDRTHQIHAFAAGSPHVERHLAFRDFMRTHAVHAREYGELKQRVAALNPTSIDGYMDGKDAFIKAVEVKALAWRRATPPPA